MEHKDQTNPPSHEVLVELGPATMTSNVTTSTNIGTIAINTATTISTAATIQKD